MKPNSAIQIEKDIPLSARGRRPGGLTETMRGMDVGDSFLAPEGHKDGSPFHMHAKFAGIKIATRKVENGRIRIWRTA